MTESRFRLDDHRARLRTQQWTAGKTGPVRSKRETNIAWISNLNRDGLRYDEREKQIQFLETTQGERVFIQYPGKEASREGNNRRPWDFRPRVLFDDGSYGPDLTFKHVWDTLFEEFEGLDEGGWNQRVLLRPCSIG